MHLFYVVDIGQDDFILGYPFFEAATPTIDCANAKIEGNTTTVTQQRFK